MKHKVFILGFAFLLISFWNISNASAAGENGTGCYTHQECNSGYCNSPCLPSGDHCSGTCQDDPNKSKDSCSGLADSTPCTCGNMFGWCHSGFCECDIKENKGSGDDRPEEGVWGFDEGSSGGGSSAGGSSNLNLPTTGLPDSSGGIGLILTKFLYWLLGIFGVIAIIAFVVSGIQYFLSVGNEDLAESAKKNITYAVIGITVALAAFIIIRAIDSVLRGNIGYY